MALALALEEDQEINTAVKVFKFGKLAVDTKPWKKCQIGKSYPLKSSPKDDLYIVTPTAQGTYPVVIFFHGFLLLNSYYSEIFKHVASHGYIIVAPQLYTVSPCNDVGDAAAVVDWLSAGLQSLLPEGVVANLKQFALAGHSRGGYETFALALGKAQTRLKFTALIGIDPVDTPIFGKVLTGKPQSFCIDAPILLVGTRLGEMPKICLLPPALAAAPDGRNHKQFFNEISTSTTPCHYFVAEEYGHLDMLDDDPNPCSLRAAIAKLVSKDAEKEKEKKCMRDFVGGIIVAFLEHSWGGNCTGDLDAIFENPAIAPVAICLPDKNATLARKKFKINQMLFICKPGPYGFGKAIVN